ncbi:SRPBCC family protein [Kribbella sp.]|uniref:SRPBCC family protein n=1 Tax=Kribbella sp. TaxID=1871183 RepID=UPI002D5270C1|nr:SRPBCC domain-containing protein [Kribbella sp.]HZX07597.1 SRPBCC domain-containing protein [Kribbella sp.]
MAHTTQAERTARAPQLRYVRTLICDPDRLWNLITRPELLSSWLGSTLLSDTEYGGFLIVTGPQTQQTGIVTTCEPPHYFQAAFDDPPHRPSTVLVDVVPAQTGSHLILTHGGIPPGRLHHYDSFWTTALDHLTQAAAGNAPLPTVTNLPSSAGGA